MNLSNPGRVAPPPSILKGENSGEPIYQYNTLVIFYLSEHIFTLAFLYYILLIWAFFFSLTFPYYFLHTILQSRVLDKVSCSIRGIHHFTPGYDATIQGVHTTLLQARYRQFIFLRLYCYAIRRETEIVGYNAQLVHMFKVPTVGKIAPCWIIGYKHSSKIRIMVDNRITEICNTKI